MKKRFYNLFIKNKIILVVSILNALLLIFFTFFLQGTIFLYGKEESLISKANIIRKSLLGLENKPDPLHFLFVNTSASNKIIDSKEIPFGNSVIRDRKTLAELLTLLNQAKEYNYIIMDIFFEEKSPDDSILQCAVNQTHRLISCNHISDSGKIISPVIDIPCGLCDIFTYNGKFSKYRLIHSDTIESLPLLVYNKLRDYNIKSGKQNKKNWFSWNLNTFILNFRIRNFDLENEKYTKVDIGQLTFLGQEAVNELSKNRIVVIGDFDGNDNFSTAIGEISGPLLLTNVILALEHGDNNIKLYQILLLFIFFVVISYLAIYPVDFIQSWINKVPEQRRVLKWLLKGLRLGVFLSIIWLIFFFAFEIQLNILIIGIYLLLLDFISLRYKQILKLFYFRRNL